MGALESGKSLVDLVLAKLPESLRAEAKKAFDAPEAKDAVILLGDSALARSDYSKAMDDLKTKQTELDDQIAAVTEDSRRLNGWWAENSPKLKSLEEENAALKAGKTVPPKKDDPPPPSGLTKEDVDKILLERDRGYASVLAVTTALTAKHLKDFDEVLDVNELVEIATKGKVSLTDAYEQKHADKLKAKAKAEDDARVKKLVDEQLAEERKKLAAQPFPLQNQTPAAIDILQQKDRDLSQYSAEAAAAEYERLVAANAARSV